MRDFKAADKRSAYPFPRRRVIKVRPLSVDVRRRRGRPRVRLENELLVLPTMKEGPKMRAQETEETPR